MNDRTKNNSGTGAEHGDPGRSHSGTLLTIPGVGSTVRLETHGTVAVLTLNRAEVLNAWNSELARDFLAALRVVETTPQIRALVLTGSGRGFCAGQDLAAVDQAKPLGPQVEAIVRENWNPAVRALRSLEVPTIAAVNGVAAGAGSSLALCCDFVFASTDASFIQSFCKIGLIPDTGATQLLPQLLGIKRARELCLLGEKLTSTEALEHGLIYRACAPDLLLSEALSLAARLAAGPTRALALTKRALGQAFHHSFEEQLELEATLQGEVAATADFREGLTAFVERRDPDYSGA